MARKTFHHLEKGETVVVENYDFMKDEALSTTDGLVVEVLKSKVAIKFVWTTYGGKRAETVQHFSKQSGYRWGAGDNDYRISAAHARTKA